MKPDVAAPTAPDRRDGWDAGIKRLNARQRGKQASLVCRTAHTRHLRRYRRTGSTRRSPHIPLTPTPPTSARPGTPNARALAGPTTDAHFVGTLRSPRSAIPMTPSRHPACPDRGCGSGAQRAPLRPPPLTPRHELQRATAPGLAGSRLRSERVGGWRGPGPGPPRRRSGAPDQWREATHGQRASGKRASKS